MKYRKKPVVIDAVRLGWDTWSEMCDFAGVGKLIDGKPEGCYVDDSGKATPDASGSGRIGLQIPTLEGLMLGVEGDYIIRGVKGELYPCKPDIFEVTYEDAGITSKDVLGAVTPIERRQEQCDMILRRKREQ